MKNFGEKVNFIWKIAELLRGPYKPEKYGDVILPMAVLRRFDCLLDDTKQAVVEKAAKTDIEMILNKIAGYGFSNKSQFDFPKLLDDPDNIKANFETYIQGFSANIREIMENFEFTNEIKKLEDNNLLFLVLKEFNNIIYILMQYQTRKWDTYLKNLLEDFQKTQKQETTILQEKS